MSESVTIPLRDGDELLNAAAAAAHLGIAPGTLAAHVGKRSHAARPFPWPEEDPVGLITDDVDVTEAVHALLRMAGNRRGLPQVWRRSVLDAWESGRLRKRSATTPGNE